MKHLSLVIIALMVSLQTMRAQTGFIRRLEASADGQGRVEVEQDSRLDAILNGELVVPSNVSTTSKVSTIATEVKVAQEADELSGRASGMHQKIRGYRVQVYFGGNQRTNQTQAQKVGAKVMTMFPELRSYTTFESPHWRCRVGDFITYDDAAAYMHKIKSKGISEAMVVRSEIYVTPDQLKKEH